MRPVAKLVHALLREFAEKTRKEQSLLSVQRECDSSLQQRVAEYACPSGGACSTQVTLNQVSPAVVAKVNSSADGQSIVSGKNPAGDSNTRLARPMFCPHQDDLVADMHLQLTTCLTMPYCLDLGPGSKVV